MSYTANGLRATTYRTVYDKDGNEISRTIEANSTYHSHDTTPAPTPTPSMTPTPTPTPKPQPTPYRRSTTPVTPVKTNTEENAV